MQSEPYHVLVVEDDPDDVYLLRQAFESARPGSVRLSVVEDGEAAIDFLSSASRPDDQASLPRLVLLDLSLPKLSGLDFLGWMRSQEGLQDLPTIVLSAKTTGREVEQAYGLGANGFLSKDVDLKHLDRVAEGLIAYLDTVDGSTARHAESALQAKPGPDGRHPPG